MIQRPRDDDELQQLEASVKEALNTFALAPDPAEVRQLDQQLPQEWTQFLDPQRDAFMAEELQQFLDAPLDLPPEQELDQLAHEALEGLDLDALLTDDLPPRLGPELDLDR